MKITMHDRYDGDITIDMRNRSEKVHEAGGMICKVAPWAASGCPITLGICICPSGEILIRGWEWNGGGGPYMHVKNLSLEEINATPEMRETVNGLFSGRIKVEGIKIAVGASVQRVCPIDLEAEEARTGKTIYLA